MHHIGRSKAFVLKKLQPRFFMVTETCALNIYISICEMLFCLFFEEPRSLEMQLRESLYLSLTFGTDIV
jgi:hypothetical protein